MKAQLDENLPRGLARALNELVAVDGHEVVHVADYAKGAPDIELFERAIADGVQIHITHDHHHRRPVEREAIARLGLTVFVLAKGWNQLTHYEKAARLIEYWPPIATTCQLVKSGASLRVPVRRSGKLEPLTKR